MKNITNNFNEIIIGKTLTSHHTYTKKVGNDQFSSLLNNNSNEKEPEQKKEQEESSDTIIPQQLELQNSSYLNKLFLFSVA